MNSKKSVSLVSMLNKAIINSKYNSLRSNVNKKWTRYLKNRRLFDEYMIYLSNYNVIGAEPITYKELSNLCYNLCGTFYMMDDNRCKHHIHVDWKSEFCKFAWDSIKWYDIKNIFLYVINKGYIKKSS